MTNWMGHSVGEIAVVLISADAEWKIVLEFYGSPTCRRTPFGQFFFRDESGQPVIFLHGGWGKIAASASTQYAIDFWHPGWLINIGTCGGFKDRINRGDIVLAEETVVYDIVEQMGDAWEAIRHYQTKLDLSFLKEPLPQQVIRGRLISADRDVVIGDVSDLWDKYKAIAADWESGAIAWVAARHQTPCLILRAVTDLVSTSGGEVYGNYDSFQQRTQEVMKPLLQNLPAWLVACGCSEIIKD